MKQTVEKILEKIKRDKKLAIIICVGLAGIFLLTLSELMPQKNKTEEKASEKSVTDIRDSYEES